MSRPHPRRAPLRPSFETLESRQLLSRGGGPVLPIGATSWRGHAGPGPGPPVAPRPDLDALGWRLAHPRQAAPLGLVGLARAMDRHAGYAARHGWGACLVMELQMHPAYTAAHHLTALVAAGPSSVTPRAPASPRPQPPALPLTSPTGTSASPSPGATLPGLADPPSPVRSSPPAAPVVPTLAQTVAVGSTLDVTLPSLGLSGPNLTYTITPQPLPANLTFNRGTGELVFAPAPWEVGTLTFAVRVSDGTRTAVAIVPITVTNPAAPSTAVSGQVVDESGHPLAGIEVMAGDRMAMTDPSGAFTLTDVPANAGPLTVDGLHTLSADRMMVMAPMDQVMGHPLYAHANNVIARPIPLPRLDVAHATDLSQLDPRKPIDLTNPALPGVHLTLPPNSVQGVGGAPFTGTVTLTSIPADLIREVLPPGVIAGLIEVDAVGLKVAQPVQVTLPNTSGYRPGTVLDLWTMNWVTGAHDLVGHMVVSPDGRSMMSQGGVVLASGAMSLGSRTLETSGSGIHAMSDPPPTTSDCIMVTPSPTGPADPPPIPDCDCGQPSAGGAGPPAGMGNDPGLIQARGSNEVMDSDAGLVTGEYFQNHATASYQSQGLDRNLDFEYSSLQADPRPVVQFDPSTQVASESSSINTITAQVTLGGVVQGSAVTYTPSALQDGTTFRVPLQVDATQLATGSYPFTMVVTADYNGGPMLSQTYQGYVDVVNGVVVGGATNPYGAGWSIGDLQRLTQPDPNGPALITTGARLTQRFDQHYVNGPVAIQDLAFASDGGTQIDTNDGLGMFTAGALAPTSALVSSAAGDFNGDGKPDLAEVTTSTLTILTNNGTGGFNVGASYPLPGGDTAEALAVGNFTGHTNGVRDLAVLVNWTNRNQLVVYPGNGDGTFGAPRFVTDIDAGPIGAGTLAVGDFNGDGGDDLALTVTSTDPSSDAYVVMGMSGNSPSVTMLNLPTGYQAIGVTTVDANGDGHPDLLWEEVNNNISDLAGPFVDLDLYTGNGTGGFSYVSTYSTGGHPDKATGGLVTGTFSGGTTLEAAIPVVGDAETFMDIVPLSAAGVWTQGVLVPVGALGSASYPGTIVAADLNGTGKPSIAWTDGSGQVRLLLADPGSNQFLPVETIGSGGGYSYGADTIAVASFAGQTATRRYVAPMGETSTLTHNADGTWTRAYPDGTVIQFDTAGREVAAADRNGNTTTYAYMISGPAAGALQTVTDPVGLVTTLGYDASGHLSTLTDPANRVTHFTIDANGNLTAITDPDNALTQYGYATPSNHRITTETNPNNHTATAQYNSFGQLASETLFDGVSTTQVGGAEGQGLLAPGGSGPLPLPDTFTGTVTDPNGHATALQFDDMGHVVGTTDANNQTTKITRDPMTGWVTIVTDPLSRTTRYQYDSRGNVTQITRDDSSVETITYDPTYSVPTAITDFRGLTTTFTLDAHGNVLRRTDPDGQHEDWTYNGAGQVLTDTDRDGHTATYHYDAYGRLDTRTHPSGTAAGSNVATGGTASASADNPSNGEGAAQAFDQDPATKWLANASAAWLQYQFGDGRSYTVTQYRMTSGDDTAAAPGRAPRDWQLLGSNDGTTWTVLDTETNQADTASSDTRTYTVAAPGSYTDYRLNITASNGDSILQLAALQLIAPAPTAVNVPASSVAFGYDPAGNLTSTTDELGHTSYTTYDPMDRVLTTQDPVQAAAGKDTAYAYDPAGNLTTVTDALGHVTTYGYDARNRRTAIIDPANQGTGRQWTYAYDGMNLTAVTDPLGHATTYGYDPDNRLTTVTDALNHTWTTAYDYDGEVTGLTDPNNNMTSYDHDTLGRLTGVTPPSTATTYGGTTYAYDADGNVTSVTDANNHVANYGYDNLNRLVWVSDANGATTRYGYDPAGNVTSVTDPLGHATINYDDVRDRLIAQVAPAGGGTTTDAYDAHSRPTSLTDPVGNVTAWGYDNADRVTTVTDPRNKVTTDVYDDVGNLTQTTDRDGRVIQYGYDADNRPTTETWVSATPAETITTTYDAAGRVTGISDAFSAYAYGYDNADRLTTVDNQGTPGVPHVVLTAGYDPAGNRASLSDSLGGLNSYTYDARDELTSLSQSGTGVAPKRVDFAYDNADNRTGLTRYSDLAGTTAVVGTTLTYDPANRLTGITHQTAGGATVAAYGYTLDDARRLTQETRTWAGGGATDTVTYGYTNDNQVTTVTHTNGAFASESFRYDANGNRAMAGDTTGTGNELTSDGTYTYAYDDEGNLISRTTISTGDQLLFTWDYRNRLTAVDQVVGGVRSVVATYTYDALDRRIGVTEGGATTWTVYDGSAPVLDFNGAGARTARYLDGPSAAGVDAVLARETPTGGVAWYLADRLGTVRDLVDNSGTVIDHVDYGVFGNVLSESNPSQGDRLVGFAGLERDPATGLNFAVHRVLLSPAGIWTSRDPWGVNAGDDNLYRYVGNDPTNYSDTSGLQKKQDKKPKFGLDPTYIIGFDPDDDDGNDDKDNEGPEDPKDPKGDPVQTPPPIGGNPPTYHGPGDYPGPGGTRGNCPRGIFTYPPGFYRGPHGNWWYFPDGITYYPDGTYIDPSTGGSVKYRDPRIGIPGPITPWTPFPKGGCMIPDPTRKPIGPVLLPVRR